MLQYQNQKIFTNKTGSKPIHKLDDQAEQRATIYIFAVASAGRPVVSCHAPPTS